MISTLFHSPIHSVHAVEHAYLKGQLMNMLKFALATAIMAVSIQASAQIAQMVYLPDFPVKKAETETVQTEPTPVEDEKAA